jgi:type I restriction enzyme, S subunit
MSSKREWERVRLGEVCEINMGQSPSSESYNKENDGIPFYQGNADFGQMHPNVRYFCNEPTKIANSNDVLLSVRAPIGALNIATEKCCIGRGLCAITQKENVSFYKYLFYILKLKSAELNAKGTGSTFKAISKTILNDFTIPLPPLDSQKYIADTLDKTQEIIDGHKKQLEELDNLIKATFYEMFGDPKVNDKGWDTVELGKVAKLIGGYAFKSEDYIENGIRLLQIANVQKDILSWEITNYLPKEYLNKYHTYNLVSGDVVLAMTRPIIKSLDAVKIAVVKDSDVPCLLNQRVGKFDVDKNLLNSDFLLQFCRSQYFKNEVELFSSNSLQPNVSSKQIESIIYYLPPIELQNKFSVIVANIEEQKFLVKKSIIESQNLFNSLMSEYFD